MFDLKKNTNTWAHEIEIIESLIFTQKSINWTQRIEANFTLDSIEIDDDDAEYENSCNRYVQMAGERMFN